MSAVEGRLFGATVAAETGLDPATIKSLISLASPAHQLTYEDDSGSRLTRNHVLEAQRLIMVQNHKLAGMNPAYFLGSLAYFDLKNSPRGSSANSNEGFLLEGGTVDKEFPGVFSNHLAAPTLLFGAWRDLIIGFWDTVDIVVDRVTAAGQPADLIHFVHGCQRLLQHIFRHQRRRLNKGGGDV